MALFFADTRTLVSLHAHWSNPDHLEVGCSPPGDWGIPEQAQGRAVVRGGGEDG